MQVENYLKRSITNRRTLILPYHAAVDEGVRTTNLKVLHFSYYTSGLTPLGLVGMSCPAM